MADIKAPERIMKAETTWCPGCGHGIATRLFAETAEALGLGDRTIVTVDVACGCLQIDTWYYDTIMTAHGRVVATAVGTKYARPDCLCAAYLGDGAAYSIGIAETLYAALRNDNVTVIIVNNNVYGMTGGQLSPTSLAGQRTTTTPRGRKTEQYGQPFDVVKVMHELPIAYLARGALTTPREIDRCRKMMTKAIVNQMENKGFSLLELLSPCPTNWGVTPLQAKARIENEIVKVYPLGEFVEGGVRL